MPRAARLPLVLLLAAGGLLIARFTPHREAPPPPQMPRDDGGASGQLEVSGLLDLLSSGHDLRRLERLVAEDRHVDAFGAAVALLAEHAERRGPFDAGTLMRLQWVAAAASAGGDRETAEDLLDALLERRRAERPGDPLRLAETLLRRGRLARVYDDPALARRRIAEARHLVERSGAAPAALRAAVAMAEGSLGLRSDREAALAGYRRALAIRQTDRPGCAVADNLTWMAWTLDRLGRTAEAGQAVLEARAILRRCGLEGTVLDATLLTLLADGQAEAARWDEAVPLYGEAARINRAARPRHLGGFARRVCPPDGHEPLALAALLRGDGDAAWLLLQGGRAPMHRDLLLLRRHAVEADPARAALRSVWRALGGRQRARDRARRTGDSAWGASTWRDTLGILALRAQGARLEQSILESAATAAPVSLREVQTRLDARTALVGWLEVDLGGAPSLVSQPRRSWRYGYVVRAGGPVRWVPLWEGAGPPEDQTDRDSWGPVFARVRRAASWPLRVEADPEIDRGLREWTRLYFDPMLPWLGGVDRLVVEGTRLPVELFRDASGRGFLDRYIVSYIPSAHVLNALAPSVRRDPPRTMLALSAAAASEAPALALVPADDERRDLRWTRNSFRRDQVSLDRLPRLRFAGIEARAVASRFQSATLLQGDATEPALRALAGSGRLGGYDVIHVATHTLFDAAPERSGLVLAERALPAAWEDDGVLEAEEIVLGWDLHGAIVTLSACESGRTAGIMRGEDLGLAPALFAAGADRVLVSLWPVDDRATALLMDRFYSGLAGSRLPPETALRDAKRALRDHEEAGRRPYEHPAYWGGFVLIGAAPPR